MDFLGDLTQCNEQTTACSEAKVGKQLFSITLELWTISMNFRMCMVHYGNQS